MQYIVVSTLANLQASVHNITDKQPTIEIPATRFNLSNFKCAVFVLVFSTTKAALNLPISDKKTRTSYVISTRLMDLKDVAYWVQVQVVIVELQSLKCDLVLF